MFSRRASTVMIALQLSALLVVSVGCGDSAALAPTAPGSPAERTGELTVVIEVAPSVLVLDSPGIWVTVHAEIPCADVDHASVTLNGVSPSVVKADSRGELVAKFAREDVDSIVAPPEALLVLEGVTVSGLPFSGADTITVE